MKTNLILLLEKTHAGISVRENSHGGVPQILNSLRNWCAPQDQHRLVNNESWHGQSADRVEWLWDHGTEVSPKMKGKAMDSESARQFVSNFLAENGGQKI